MFIRWVHCETLVATLMAYQHTHNIENYKNLRRKDLSDKSILPLSLPPQQIILCSILHLERKNEETFREREREKENLESEKERERESCSICVYM